MKNTILYLLPLLFMLSCSQEEITEPQTQYSVASFKLPQMPDHPNAANYQYILENNTKGIVGATLYIKDKYGSWTSATGKADITMNVNVVPDHRFLIASISKVFTATAIFKAEEEGLLSIQDPISDYIDASILSHIKQANDCNLAHLLNHTSGLADYYTVQFELDRINANHQWSQEDILKYTYGKSPTNKVGETYFYSNTNFLLLGMILESVYHISLKEVYQSKIFDPIYLKSAFFSTSDNIPTGTVKGYVDMYGTGEFVESGFLYADELGTGDGGIAINAYDLGIFFEKLMKEEIINSKSLEKMTNWIPLPDDWVDENIGHSMNGLGLEYNQTPYGSSVGHTGGIDGFLSIAQYFPEQDYTLILLTNSASYDSSSLLKIYHDCLSQMFMN